MNLEGKEHYEDAVCSTAVGRHTDRNARGGAHFTGLRAGRAAKSAGSASQTGHAHRAGFAWFRKVQLHARAQAISEPARSLQPNQDRIARAHQFAAYRTAYPRTQAGV